MIVPLDNSLPGKHATVKILKSQRFHIEGVIVPYDENKSNTNSIDIVKEKESLALNSYQSKSTIFMIGGITLATLVITSIFMIRKR